MRGFYSIQIYTTCTSNKFVGMESKRNENYLNNKGDLAKLIEQNAKLYIL